MSSLPVGTSVGTFCCLDSGSSEIRFTGQGVENIELPNNVTDVDLDTNTRMKRSEASLFEERIKQSLDLTVIKLDGVSDYFNKPVRFLAGDIADRYSSSSKRLSGMLNKHSQKIYFQNVITAIAVNQLLNNSNEDEVYLHMSLPPIEVASASDYVEEQMLGKWTVVFNELDSKEITIDIVGVRVCEESSMAITSFFFNDSLQPRDESMKYIAGDLLSIDIGAGTTDLATVKDRRFVEKSGMTYKIGGNTVRDTVSSMVRGKYGFDLPVDMAEEAVATGRIRLGNSNEDISAFVQKAKKEFVGQMVNSFDNYFRIIGKPLQSFTGIVVSGGGSMVGGYYDVDKEFVETSKPMSEYLWEELKVVCPNIEVLDVGDMPRYANLRGLFVRAMFDMQMRKSSLGKKPITQ